MDTNNHTENTQLDYNGLFDTDHDNNNGDILVKNDLDATEENSDPSVWLYKGSRIRRCLFWW